jgi:hypothetical protein
MRGSLLSMHSPLKLPDLREYYGIDPKVPLLPKAQDHRIATLRGHEETVEETPVEELLLA